MTTLASTHGPPAGGVRRNWAPSLLTLAAGAVIVLAAHGDTLAAIVATWSRQTTYHYAWLVLPAFAYVLWVRRDDVAGLGPRGSLLGVGAAVLAVALGTVSDWLNVAEGRQFALLGLLGALALAVLGRAVFARLLPVLAMLVLLVPTGGYLLDPLRYLLVAIVRGFAAVAGLPLRYEGFTLHVGVHRYVVVEACAGLPLLLIGLFTGLTFGLLLYRRWRRIAVTALVGGLLGLATNGLRVMAIVLVDHVTGVQMAVASHQYFEWAAVALTLALMLGVLAVLPVERSPVPGQPPEQAPGRASGLLWGAVVVAVAFAGRGLAGGPEVSPTGAEMALPERLAGWERTGPGTNWRPEAPQAASATLAGYRRGDRAITVFAATAEASADEVTGQGVRLARASDWMPGATRSYDACRDARCVPVSSLIHLQRDSDRVRHLYTALWHDGAFQRSALTLRLARGWAVAVGQSPRAVRFTVATERAEGLDGAELAAVLTALAEAAQRPSAGVGLPLPRESGR